MAGIHWPKFMGNEYTTDWHAIRGVPWRVSRKQANDMTAGGLISMPLISNIRATMEHFLNIPP